MVDGISWQAIFWINVPVALVAVPLAYVALKETAGRIQPLDLLGAVLAGGGVFLLVWAVVHGNDDGWASTTVLAGFIGSAVLLVAFVLRASRTRHSVLPLALFRSRSFTIANIIGITFSLGMFGAVFLLAQYLQIVMNYTPFQAGLRTLPWTAAPMVVAPIAGLLAERVGLRGLLVAGLSLQSVSLVWMALILGPDTEYLSMVPALLMAGVGMGLTFAPSATAVLRDMKDEDHATASSANSTVREVGIALGIAVLTAVFIGAGGSLTPPATPTPGTRPARRRRGSGDRTRGGAVHAGAFRRTGGSAHGWPGNAVDDGVTPEFAATSRGEPQRRSTPARPCRGSLPTGCVRSTNATRCSYRSRPAQPTAQPRSRRSPGTGDAYAGSGSGTVTLAARSASMVASRRAR